MALAEPLRHNQAEDGGQMVLDLTEQEVETLECCEKVIASGLRTFFAVADALATIRDQRLYRATHRTFDDYCRERWSVSKSHANRMIAAAEVAANLAPIGVKLENEAQARALTGLTPEQQIETVQRAQEADPEAKLTAARLQESREEIAPKTTPGVETNAAIEAMEKMLGPAEETEPEPDAAGLQAPAVPAGESAYRLIDADLMARLVRCGAGSTITNGRISPPILMDDGRLYVGLVPVKTETETRCAAQRLTELDTYIDLFYQTPGYKKPLWEHDWQAEVESGKRREDDYELLKVIDTNGRYYVCLPDRVLFVHRHEAEKPAPSTPTSPSPALVSSPEPAALPVVTDWRIQAVALVGNMQDMANMLRALLRDQGVEMIRLTADIYEIDGALKRLHYFFAEPAPNPDDDGDTSEEPVETLPENRPVGEETARLCQSCGVEPVGADQRYCVECDPSTVSLTVAEGRVQTWHEANQKCVRCCVRSARPGLTTCAECDGGVA